MASSEYSVSALINRDHSGSSPIVDTNMSSVGNSDVTYSEILVMLRCGHR
jgi:hypothetical protein